MIPFYEHPLLRLGPLTIYAFGVVVAVAVGVALEMWQRRVTKLNLNAAVAQQVATWVIVCSVVGSHLFSVLFYFPEKIAANPWHLLRVWDDISSFGGILGGVAGLALYFSFRAPAEQRARKWEYVDCVAYVFPFALAIGRLGCALAHDHPGRVTTFPLAISLETEGARQFITDVYTSPEAPAPLPPNAELATMGFHDLGWYEMLFLALIVLPILFVANSRYNARGFNFILFPALYLPVRFGLDFLRVVDARYAGLTPAQWVAVVAFVSLPLIWARVRAARSV